MKPQLPKIIRRKALVPEKIEAPGLILLAGDNARYAWEEFVCGEISNANTRRAYSKAISDLLSEAEQSKLSFAEISPKFIRRHFERMEVSVPTKKLRLSGIKRFFDIAVTRHAIALNPALSVRGERYRAVEGKTPEITPTQAAKLLKSCDETSLIGMRDKTIIALLIYTAARVGAAAGLSCSDFITTENQYSLKFKEKGGKSREIPVRHDLELLIKRYLELRVIESKALPLFPSAIGKTGTLSNARMKPDDIRRMLKRRLKEAGLSSQFSPHSFRVCTLTDLLKQEVPRKDVQHLAGHADARTTAGIIFAKERGLPRSITRLADVTLSS